MRRGPLPKPVGSVLQSIASKHGRTPFAQFVMTLGAIIRTAEQLFVERAGVPEAKDAEAFIDAISEEKCVQIGMLADAADESLLLTSV